MHGLVCTMFEFLDQTQEYYFEVLDRQQFQCTQRVKFYSLNIGPENGPPHPARHTYLLRWHVGTGPLFSFA